MNKEEIVTELLENYTWDIFSGNMWVNEEGALFIPWDDGDSEDEILLRVGEWVESSYDEDAILDMSEPDFVWVIEKVTAHFTERYREYLTEQLDRLQGAENA